MDLRSYPRNSRGDHNSGSSESFRPLRSPDEEGTGQRPSGRRRMEQDSKSNLLAIRLVGFGAIGVIGLIAFVVIGLLRSKREGGAGWKNPSVMVFDEPVLTPEASLDTPSEKAAVALVKKVLSMKKASEFGNSIRLKGMTESEAEDFLAHLEERNGKIERMEWQSTVNANGLKLEGVVVYFAGGFMKSRLAFLTPDEKGIWQLDLASFARKSTLKWEDLYKDTERQGRIRAACGPYSYFNGAYSDESVWSGYQLVTPDEEITLAGYCPKGGPVDKALQSALRNSRVMRVIVDVKKSGPANNRQCEILSVVAEDWVESSTPFDAKFR